MRCNVQVPLSILAELSLAEVPDGATRAVSTAHPVHLWVRLRIQR